MLNLLRFRETAAYAEGQGEAGASGRAAYAAYSRAVLPMLQRSGARPIWQGEAKSTFIAPAGEQWDEVLLVAYDAAGQITDFGALEVQAVYISGNVRRPFEAYIRDSQDFLVNPPQSREAPRADYLSSSRKRLAPQLIYKGGILHEWGKRSAVALHQAFFETLPPLPEVPPEQAEVAWFLYDLAIDGEQYALKRTRTVYTAFADALAAITRSTAGAMPDFVQKLQAKLGEKLGSAPIAPTIAGEFEL